MGLNVRMRLIQLEYEWDAVNRTHKLIWDTDYPVNVTGIVTKVFKPYHEYSMGDKITINDEVYTFTTLNGKTPRNNAFTVDQYVPIAIDLDEKNIAYYSGIGGGGSSGGGEVINADIRFTDWNASNQYIIPVEGITDNMVVLLNIPQDIEDVEKHYIVDAGINGEIVSEGILLTASVKPTSNMHIQIVLL